MRASLNPLIAHWFDARIAQRGEFIPHCNISGPGFRSERFRWRTFHSSLVYMGGRSSSGSTRRAKMAWKAPKIVEVPVGMEINMYACAARK
jgi:coenzyme PQQ precursor peptide PqqA